MFLKQLVTILISCVLVACASTENENSEATEETVSNRMDCISQSSIRDYTVLDDTNLIVSERASRRFHVVLTRRAYGLRSSPRIGFQSQAGRICGRFDDLIYEAGFGPEKIRIASVRRLTPEQEQDLLVQFGLREPEFEQPRQPQEVEGAEVEELD